MIDAPHSTPSGPHTRGLQTGTSLLLLLALAGCSQFQPYQRPELALPAQWQGATASVAGNAAVTAAPPWQEVVLDPQLREVVVLALAHNQDARIAAAQIEQLRAQWRIRQAARLPTLELGLGGERQSTGEQQPIQSSYRAGLQISGWEIDFFGRLESLGAAAQAQFLASEEALKFTHIALVAGVASAWLDVGLAQAQLGLAERTLATRTDSLRLTRLRFEQGAASALEWRTAQALHAAAQGAQAQALLQQAQARNALTLLVGAPLPETAWPAQATPHTAWADVAVGLPAHVLLARPDIRSAEQALAAADAHIGAARAAFFPRIGLTASLGSASNELSALLGGGSWGWALAPQALLTVFDGGSQRAQLASVQAARSAALAQYEKAIHSALREVNDALAGQTTLRQQAQAQEALLAAEQERLRLTQLRLAQGVASQLEWLDAQRSLFSAEQTALQAHYAVQHNRVALYRALGGF